MARKHHLTAPSVVYYENRKVEPGDFNIIATSHESVDCSLHIAVPQQLQNILGHQMTSVEQLYRELYAAFDHLVHEHSWSPTEVNRALCDLKNVLRPFVPETFFREVERKR